MCVVGGGLFVGFGVVGLWVMRGGDLGFIDGVLPFGGEVVDVVEVILAAAVVDDI